MATKTLRDRSPRNAAVLGAVESTAGTRTDHRFANVTELKGTNTSEPDDHVSAGETSATVVSPRISTHGSPSSPLPTRAGTASSQGNDKSSTARPKDGFGTRISGGSGPKAVAVKNHIIAMIGEFVGTTMFLFIALGGTQVANIPSTAINTGGNAATQSLNTSSLLYISLSFGFSLAVNAWIFYRVSGGLFNPAISFAMTMIGALPPLRGGLLAVAQIIGGMTGTALIQALLPGTLYVETKLNAGTSIPQGLFLEMFLTALLMMSIFLLAVDKSKATFIAPVGIGLTLFICELVGVYYTGGSLNPARSFGPCVVLRSFPGYHWIYWVGPGLGAMLAAGFYKFLKIMNYEHANPGQDAGHEEEEKAASDGTDVEAQQGSST